jgi:predicted nucleic acid-binding protein
VIVAAVLFAADTSCLVAAVCGWHEHHELAATAIESRLARGETLSVAAHALAEAYAVLTRLPPPHRLAPADAWRLIDANFTRDVRVVALSGREYVKLLGGLPAAAVAGGRTYDAIIAECARRAGVSTLLTLNPRHFDPPPAGVAIVVPG